MNDAGRTARDSSEDIRLVFEAMFGSTQKPGVYHVLVEQGKQMVEQGRQIGELAKSVGALAQAVGDGSTMGALHDIAQTREMHRENSDRLASIEKASIDVAQTQKESAAATSERLWKFGMIILGALFSVGAGVIGLILRVLYLIFTTSGHLAGHP